MKVGKNYSGAAIFGIGFRPKCAFALDNAQIPGDVIECGVGGKIPIFFLTGRGGGGTIHPNYDCATNFCATHRDFAISRHGITIGVWIVLFSAVAASAQPAAKTNPAAEAARKRQGLIKTITVEYKRTTTESPGSQSDDLPGALKRKDGKRVPDRETTSESVGRVVIDGDKIRVEDNHPRWNMRDGTLNRRGVVAVDDRHVAKTLNSNLSGKYASQGTLSSPSDRSGLSDPIWNPILITFRGAEPEICPYPVSTMRAAATAVPVEGSPCDEYVGKLGQMDIVACFDPKQEFALRRLIKRRDKRTIHLLDVHSKHDEKWGWIPKSWVLRDYGAQGVLLRTTRIEMISMQIGEPVNTEEFDVKFPPGTLVYDNRNTKYYTVRDDGTMRELGPNGEWVEESVSSRLDQYKWLLTSVGLVVLFCVGSVFFYRSRKSRTRA